MAENALYYPYIHIRDIDWLKGTLLLFSQVRRMVPGNWTPDDGADLRPFLESKSGEPLLQSTNLFADRVERAQRTLAEKLARDADNPEFQKNYGFEATRAGVSTDDLGFQVHQGKLSSDFQHALSRLRLSWGPANPEPHDKREEYIELHPKVGQAVMATIAIACAKGEGLDIVGDKRSEGLHQCLLDKDEDAVYDAWLHPDARLNDPKEVTNRELFEFFVRFHCNVTAVTPEKLYSLGKDRQPLRKVMSRLQEHAARIASMDPGPRRDERFKDEVSSVLKEWDNDRANMSSTWREFFGKGLADAVSKFLEKVTDKIFTGAASGASAGLLGAQTGSGLASATFIGAGTGLAIGLIVHTGKSIATVRERGRESPYRYLTLMKEAGAVFRSDIREIDPYRHLSL
jgi:hypothetical protein